MPKILAAASLVAALALSAPLAFAQTDSTGGTMSDKTMTDSTMAPKKPMMKHHSMHKQPMHKTKMQSDTMKGGETQQKM